MSETDVRAFVVEALRRHCAFAVENYVHDGTPDVCCALGWIELKEVDGFPARDTSLVGVVHRKAQRIWMRRWTHVGGSACVLTVVGGEWFIHDGAWAARHLARADVTTFRSAALTSWTSKPSPESLREALEVILGREQARHESTRDDSDTQS